MGWSLIRPIKHTEAQLINACIPFFQVLHGYKNYGSPWLYQAFRNFSILMTAIMICCGGMQWLGVRYGNRLQPDKPHAFVDGGDAKTRQLLIEEFLETARCMFVVSCMAAWPLTNFAQGGPTGLVWSLDEAGTTFAMYVFAGFVPGIFVADGWLYLKHRLLHTRWLWAFHAHHHQFKNPTAFGGFAVSPFEALWTFAAIGLWSHMPHWIPLVGPSIFAFFVFNCYLHCGFSFSAVEVIAPALLLDSSCYHNVHHEKVSTHFGEISSLWDYVFGTSAIYNKGLVAGYKWHLERHKARA